METPLSLDFKTTELLPSTGRTRYATFDRRFRARRDPHRGWILTDTKNPLAREPICDSLEMCQIRVVEQLLAERLGALLAFPDKILRSHLEALRDALSP